MRGRRVGAAGAALIAGAIAVLGAAPAPDCASWIYAGARTTRCFSDAFLRLLADPAQGPGIDVAPAFVPVRLGSPEVFDHPFALWSGEGPFQLREEERRNLRAYLEGGGFVLASAGCSSPPWDRAFRREIATVFPDAELAPLGRDHPIFRARFEVDRLPLAKGGEARLLGLALEGRLALVYSPEGLNDTAKIPDCCCCGANEVRDSAPLVANIFLYAILH